MRYHACFTLGLAVLLAAPASAEERKTPVYPEAELNNTEKVARDRGEQEGDGDKTVNATAKCPVMGDAASGRDSAFTEGYDNQDWWPNRLKLEVLHQNAPIANPLGANFNYAEEFAKLDVAALTRDVDALMTSSQDWWPADYGHYGPFFIRMAWHAAGTYRVADGRGGGSTGTLRFAPLNSWPDNGNLDKARRLLWPIKQKYGNKISWADLVAYTGNRSLETMGFRTYGFAFGREDLWEPEIDIYWGSETEWLGGDKRYSGDRVLAVPLAASQLGLIYVNPQGPDGNPDPVAAAVDIRETFGRMAMNDEETVALIAGGHTFGKAHGAAEPEKYVGPEPEAAPVEGQGLGWKNKFGTGNAQYTITSGLEGAWTTTPAQWSMDYFDHLFNYEWELTKSPGGAAQWRPVDRSHDDEVPDAHDPEKSHPPMMFTTDLSLREDPTYAPISRRFHEDEEAFKTAFAKAWYKLLHRDLGPYVRCLGPKVPEPQLWQDPVPAADYEIIGDSHIAELKSMLLDSGLSTSQLVTTAWASASTFRNSDKRGGANGARIRLEPQRSWEANNPQQLDKILTKLESVQKEFNDSQTGDVRVSMADLIVLGGCVAIEDAAQKAGRKVNVPFTPGRTDATAEMTDAEAMAPLEPTADGFRNYFSHTSTRRAEEALVDQAQLLALSAPEMTVLVGGLRSLGVTAGPANLGVLTDQPQTLTNDFFVNLLDMDLQWDKSSVCEHFFEGRTGDGQPVKWTASSVDLLFGSNSQLRAIAEVYAQSDAGDKFVDDFVDAWVYVMNADRFDLDRSTRRGNASVVMNR